MLSDKDAMATVAVKDLAAAKEFYEGKLGFKRVGPDDPEALSYASGRSRLVVYRSEFAGTNKATSVTFGAGGDLDAIVKALKDAGIAFEHYDMPGGKREGDVHIFGDLKAVWFTDPDGNIIHINNM